MLDTSAFTVPTLTVPGAAPAAALAVARPEGTVAVDFSAVLAGLNLGTDLAEAPEQAPAPPIDPATIQAANSGKFGTVGKNSGKILPSGKQPAEPGLADAEPHDPEVDLTQAGEEHTAARDVPAFTVRDTLAFHDHSALPVQQPIVAPAGATAAHAAGPPQPEAPAQPRRSHERQTLKTSTALPLAAAVPLQRVTTAARPDVSPILAASQGTSQPVQTPQAMAPVQAAASDIVATTPRPSSTRQPAPVIAAALVQPAKLEGARVAAPTLASSDATAPDAAGDAAPTSAAVLTEPQPAKAALEARSVRPHTGEHVPVAAPTPFVAAPIFITASAGETSLQLQLQAPLIPAAATAATPDIEPATAQQPVIAAVAATIVSNEAARGPAPVAELASSGSARKIEAEVVAPTPAAATPSQAAAAPAEHLRQPEPGARADAETLHASLSLRATASADIAQPGVVAPVLEPLPAPTTVMPDARPILTPASAPAAEITAGPDLAALVDRIVEARAAAAPDTVRAALVHEEFGSVSLRLRTEDAHIHVTLGSADPGFAPAVHAAASASLSRNADDPNRREQQPQHLPGQDAPAPQAQTSQQHQSSRNPAFTGERVPTRDSGQDRNTPEQARQSQTAPDRHGGIYA